MGEAAPQYPELDDPKPKAPLGALFDLEPGPKVWPALEFKWDERAIFGSKTSSTNKDTRLISVVDSILEAAPELRFVLGGQTAIEVKRQTNNATINRTRVGGNQSMRSYNVDHPEVFEVIWSDKMGSSNHPAVQAWHAVREINSSRRGRSPVLADSELANLTVDLIYVFAGDDIREAYDQQSET